MTQPKHTPGPWRVEFSDRMYSDAARIRGDDRTVAVVNADDTAEIEDGAIAEVLSATARADAELIAAAPALADALETLYTSAGVFFGSHLEQVVTALRAAGRLAEDARSAK